MSDKYKIAWVATAVCLFFSFGCQLYRSEIQNQLDETEMAMFSMPEKIRSPDFGPAVIPRAATEALSLAECIEAALLNSPKVRRSLQITYAEAARADRARSPIFPQAKIEAESKGRQEQRERYEVSFGVRQLLFDFGAVKAKRESADSALMASRFRHHELLIEIALATQINYYRLLNAEARLEAAEESVNQRRKHIELAEARYETGFANRSEVLQARVLLSQVELEVVNERGRIRDARGRLAATMGLRPSTEFEIQDIPEEVMYEELADADRLINEAAESRPALQSAVAEIMSIKSAVRAEEAARWPTLSAAAQVGASGDKLFPTEEEWSVGLSLQWPLFTGFERTHRIREQQAMAEAAFEEYEDRLRDVELEVWKAYSELLRANQAISAADSYLNGAEESLRVIEAEYEEGRIGIVELSDAQTKLTHARVSKAEARLRWHMAMSELERAVGKQLRMGWE